MECHKTAKIVLFNVFLWMDLQMLSRELSIFSILIDWKLDTTLNFMLIKSLFFSFQYASCLGGAETYLYQDNLNSTCAWIIMIPVKCSLLW